MKRARPGASYPTQRVVIDVGGTKLTTTTATITRSSYLAGMIDLDAWSSDADHCAEIFLDRDPDVFAQLLRLMRQQPHIAGLLPTDPQQCASVIAEADFFGFEGLLTHVKVQAYYNSREPKDDHPSFTRPAMAAGNNWNEWSARSRQAREQHAAECRRIDALFESNDEAHALSRFDEVHGDIGAALRSGVLPSYFLNRKPPKPQPVKKLVQVMPTDATTWFLIGRVNDPKYGFRSEHVPMVNMEVAVAQPAKVLRVVCQALVEDENGQRWLEPMVNLRPIDLEELMHDDEDGDNTGEQLTYGINIVEDTGLTKVTGGPARRTMLASDWMEKAPSIIDLADNGDQLWTHLLIAETPPLEFGFEFYEG